MTRLRYSEITPQLHAGLRILAALEPAYPQCGDKASRTLAGYDAWRKAASPAEREMHPRETVKPTLPIPQAKQDRSQENEGKQDHMSSQDHAPNIGGSAE